MAIVYNSPDIGSLYSYINNMGSSITSAIQNNNNWISQMIYQASANTTNALASQINNQSNGFTQTQYAIANNITGQLGPLYQKSIEILNRIVEPHPPDLSPIINTISNVVNTVNSTIANVNNALNARILETKLDTQSRIQGVVNQVSQVYSSVQSALQNVIGAGNQQAASAINSIFGPAISSVTNTIGAITSAISQINQEQKQSILGALNLSSEAIKSAQSGATESVKAAIDSSGRVYTQLSSELVNTSKVAIQSIKDTVDEIVKKPPVKQPLELPPEVIKTIDEVNKSLAKISEGIDKDSPQLDLFGDLTQQIIASVRNFFLFIQDLASGKYTDIEQVSSKIFPIFDDKANMVTAISGVISIFPLAIQLANFTGIALQEQVRQLSLKKYTPGIPDAQTAAMLFTRNEITYGEMIEAAKRNGFNEKWADDLARLAYNPLSPKEYLTAYLMGLQDQNTYRNNLKRNRLNEEDIKIADKLNYAPLNPGDYLRAWHMGEIDNHYVDSMLKRMTFNEDDIVLLKAISFPIPNVPDLIRMAVREVFSPDIAEKFGQYQDYPDDFDRYAAKAGVSREWARRYWAAHWELPSLMMGFEMLHRDVIDSDTLRLLMRAQDVMPYWRDKLEKISYSPLTRVDVRRMYKLGVLTREEVVRAYKDLGYDNRNAERLAEFTVRYETASDADDLTDIKTVTRATIEKAYVNGVMDYNTALTRLMEIGYVQDDANLFLRLKDFDKSVGVVESVDTDFASRGIKMVKDAYLRKVYSESEAVNALIALGYNPSQASTEVSYLSYEYDRKLKNNAIEIVKKGYVERTIDRNSAIALLNAFAVDGTEQQELLAELDAFKELRIEKIPYTQLRTLLRQGIVSPEDFIEELRGLGYAEKYIIWLAQAEGIEI